MLFDFRLAVRSLRRNPGFAFAATSALALGIGANAAIFSLVNQVLLNPAGIAQPERVVALRARYTKLNLRSIGVSVPDFADVRNSRRFFEHAAVLNQGDFNYTGSGQPERLRGASVSVEWFDVFGARPMLGRTFTTAEDQPNANQVIVLSFAAWKRLYGSDRGALGKTILLNERPYRIVGVMGPEFRWPREIDLWAPLGLAPDAFTERNRFNENFQGFARLRPGVSVAQADALIQVLADRMRNSGTQGAAYARDSGWGMFAISMTDFLAGDTKRPLLILLGAVGFVLLIACSNIAGLMLARSSARAREVAVRAALGAGRWALMRQTLAESGVLAGAGAAAGLALGYFGAKLLLLLAPENATAGLSSRLDLPVLLFTAVAAAASGLFFGLIPAWHVARLDANEILKGSGRSGTEGRGRQRLRSALVVAETALALVLLVGAGLFLRSLMRVEEVRPGFEPRNVMTASLTLPRTGYPDNTSRIAFYRALNERLAAARGVTVAAMGLPLPFSGNQSSASFRIREKPTGPGDPGPHGDIRTITPGYFRALGIPLLSGRDFSDRDRENTERVAIIDENLARQYWPGENPLGQHISGGVPGQEWAVVIGVVGHIRHSDLAADTGKGVYYYCMWQAARPYTSIVLRTAGDPAAYGPAIREAVREVDPAQPVAQLRTLADMVSESLTPRRFAVRVLAFFAAVALLMAALGLYGVISYSVAQRTRELGIRAALGASRRTVMLLVVGQGARLAVTGAAIGLVASIACTRWVKSQLFEVGAFDPLVFASMALVLVGAALAASYIPARRAMNVDPSEALRYE